MNEFQTFGFVMQGQKYPVHRGLCGLCVVCGLFLLYLVHFETGVELYFTPMKNSTSSKMKVLYHRLQFSKRFLPYIAYNSQTFEHDISTIYTSASGKASDDTETNKQNNGFNNRSYNQIPGNNTGAFKDIGDDQADANKEDSEYEPELRNLDLGFSSTQAVRDSTVGMGTTTFDQPIYPSDFSTVNGIKHWELFGDETRAFKCGSAHTVTSHVYSKLFLTGVDEKKRIVYVVIQTHDRRNRRKTSGGDVIFLWAKQKVGPKFNRVGGRIYDHLNGTYTGEIQIPWSGVSVVGAKIVASYRTSCMRVRAMAKYGTSVYANEFPYGIHYLFEQGNVSELTRCSPSAFVYGYDRVCNFTDMNFGLSWFCGKPTTSGLNCSHFRKFGMIEYNDRSVENRSYSDVIQILGINQLRHKVVVGLPREEYRLNFRTNVKCSERDPLQSWTEKLPSGVVVRGKWRINGCRNIYLTSSSVIKCLANKTVFLLGDSTIRQYLNALGTFVKSKISKYPYHIDAISNQHNIHMFWRKHEMPFHNFGVHSTPDLVYSTTDGIREIADNDTLEASNIILLLHYNSHFQAFPVSVFRDRMQHIVSAIKYLISRKPGCKILFKGPHTCHDSEKWFDARVALMFRDIVFEEFLPVRDHVTYLDVMSITVAFDNGDLHPSGGTLKAQVQQLLAYIC